MPYALGIIPARYGSQRFPGKPLAILQGKPMIQHTYERALAAGLDAVVVATDDERIVAAVEAFGGRAAMTSPAHQSGTDRCAEVLAQWPSAVDIVVNVQGDEPFIHPQDIRQVADLLLARPEWSLATLATPIREAEKLFSPHVVKVVRDSLGHALYFSRHAIPFRRDVPPGEAWLAEGAYLKHIGLYAYRAEVLLALTRLGISALERAESLEQLRWLEAGYRIGLGLTEHEARGVDTPADLADLQNKAT